MLATGDDVSFPSICPLLSTHLVHSFVRAAPTNIFLKFPLFNVRDDSGMEVAEIDSQQQERSHKFGFDDKSFGFAAYVLRFPFVLSLIIS